MLRATLTIHGDPKAVSELIRLLHGQSDLQITYQAGPPFETIDWGAHPALGRVSLTEREIMRLDLAQQPRRLIARALELTPGTVTVYRRMIRSKLRTLPDEQCPAAVREWLRRFPGQPGGTFGPARGLPDTPQDPAEPEDPSE